MCWETWWLATCVLLEGEEVEQKTWTPISDEAAPPQCFVAMHPAHPGIAPSTPGVSNWGSTII